MARGTEEWYTVERHHVVVDGMVRRTWYDVISPEGLGWYRCEVGVFGTAPECAAGAHLLCRFPFEPMKWADTWADTT